MGTDERPSSEEMMAKRILEVMPLRHEKSARQMAKVIYGEDMEGTMAKVFEHRVERITEQILIPNGLATKRGITINGNRFTVYKRTE